MSARADEAVLSVEGLEVEYRTSGATHRVLPGVDLTLEKAEVLGLVGESGSGKSTLAAAILRLLPPNGAIVGGRVVLAGDIEVSRLGTEALRQVRGTEVGMIFQDPLTCLNPTFRVGSQMVDVQAAHAGRRPGRNERRLYRRRALDLLAQVGLPDASHVAAAYPHQLSGGMRQRVMIAMALSLDPKLLIADEPTSALDVTLEAQIIELLAQLRESRHMSILFVTHDLGVVSQICDRVAVMYAGQIVEEGRVGDVFAEPQHPYTEALLEAVPSRALRGRRLAVIPGQVVAAGSMVTGCRFANRCREAQEICRSSEPPPVRVGKSESVRCHLRPRSPGARADDEVAVH